MSLRTCTDCGKEAPDKAGLEHFFKHSRSTHGRANLCKECWSKRIIKYRSVRTAFVNWLKSRPCADCGQCYPPVCLDFDHVRGEKKFPISRWVRTGRWSMAKLQEELQKCELVCCNCHRIRTWGDHANP